MPILRDLLATFFCAGMLMGADAPVMAGTCDGLPDVCRIESAYQAGLAKTDDPDETLACLQVRNEALGVSVERAYQATLAWLAERGDLLTVLQGDQAQWQERLKALSPPDDAPPAAKKAALEKASALLLERLRAFNAIVDNAGLADANG